MLAKKPPSGLIEFNLLSNKKFKVTPDEVVALSTSPFVYLEKSESGFREFPLSDIFQW